MKLLKEFKTFLHEKGKSKNTINTYYHEIKDYLKWFNENNHYLSWLEENDEQLRQLSFHDVIEYKEFLLKLNKSPRIINHYLSTLKKYNEFLIFKGIQNESVFNQKTIRFKLIKDDNLIIKDKINNVDEISIFIENIKKYSSVRNYLIIIFLYNYKLKLSEVINIKLDDCDFETRTLKIIQKGSLKKSFHLSMDELNLLNKYLEKRFNRKSEYLFTSRENEQIDRTMINKIFRMFSDNITPKMLSN